MNILGLDRARVLYALYHDARVLGLGVLQAAKAPDVTVEHCRKLLLEDPRKFYYLYGRALKVRLNFTNNELDLQGYDRDNGPGAGERCIRREFEIED